MLVIFVLWGIVPAVRGFFKPPKSQFDVIGPVAICGFFLAIILWQAPMPVGLKDEAYVAAIFGMLLGQMVGVWRAHRLGVWGVRDN